MSPRRTTRDLSAVDVSVTVPTRRGRRLKEVQGGASIPAPFQALVDDPALPGLLHLELDVEQRRVVCRGFTLTSRDDGPAVTGTTLRLLPLDSYVQLALSHSLPLEADGDGYEPASGATRDRMLKAQTRRRDTDVLLREVVAAYRAALAHPDPKIRNKPTAHVSQQLGYARGHVSRLLSRARDEGLLGAASRGRGGEA